MFYPASREATRKAAPLLPDAGFFLKATLKGVFIMEIAKWIRPDWSDARQYQNYGNDLFRWYWEFLRRREDYQRDFYKFAPKTYELYSNLSFYKERGLDVLTPNDSGFSAQIPNAHKKYSIMVCPNPAIDNPPQFHYKSVNSTVYSKIGSNEEQRIVTGCDGNELFFRFDLSMPIEKQLEAAKSVLEMQQKYYLYKTTGNEDPKLIQRRAHTSKWVSYLRALDAVHDGQTLEEIGLEIEPPGDDDDRLSGRIGQKLVNAARKVQFNFPF